MAELAQFIGKCLKFKSTSNLIQVLSPFHPIFTRKELNSALSAFDCHVSEYYRHKAHLHRLKYGAGITEKKQFNRSNTRTSSTTIQQAVKFAKKNKYYKPVAFGGHKVKLSDGSKVTLPNYVRKVTKGKAWMDYRTSLSLNDKVSRSTFYSILDVIGCQDDKLLAALDSYSMKYGNENFKSIINFINVITFNKPDAQKNLSNEVHNIKAYLKYDFCNHMQENHECFCRSFRYAFGERDYPKKFICSKCFAIISFKNNLFSTLEAIDASSPILRSNSKPLLMTHFESLIENMLLYIAHLVRGQWESTVLQTLYDKLSNHEIAIVMDWKMKLNRESMEESSQSEE